MPVAAIIMRNLWSGARQTDRQTRQTDKTDGPTGATATKITTSDGDDIASIPSKRRRTMRRRRPVEREKEANDGELLVL